jgi:hypothetical protein
MKKIVALILLLLAAGKYSTAQLVNYPAPPGSSLNSDFTVKVRQAGKAWQQVATYLARVTNVEGTKSIVENTSFAYFDFVGEVEVSVTANRGSIKDVRIRPLSYGISSKTSGNTLTFSLTRPENLSIEINGDIFHNLQLFANPVEIFKHSPADTNIIYYGPGLHNIGNMKVPSNKTIYIAGGAVVQGRFLISKAENIHIMGHGILTQLLTLPDTFKTPQSRTSGRADALTVEFSKNVEINGIIVLPHKYSVLIGQSTGVAIKNFRSISSEGNADGIDIFCSTDVNIDKIFMRNSDDCVCIYGHRWAYYGNTKKISVQNSSLWADMAHPVLIGTHGDTPHPDTLENMKFSNIDILDQHENQIDYQGCMALNAGDHNLVRKINFDNIRIEDIREGQLVNMRVMFNHKYNTSPGQGIEDIYFKNISYTGKKVNLSIIAGYDEHHLVKNVTFENLTINGTVISDTMPGKPGYYKTSDMANIFIGENTDNIKFITTQKQITK